MPKGTRDQIKAQRKRWKLKNKEKIKFAKKRYYRDHPEKRKEEQKRYKKKYPEKNRDAAKRSLQKVRLEVLTHYSEGTPVCAKCGESHLEFLEIDHIGGGGKQHLREINGNLCTWLRKNHFPEGFQVLCSNCNIKKVKLEAKTRGTTGTKDQKKWYRRNERLKIEVFSHYSKDNLIMCACCGESDQDVLAIDHINGGGEKHRRSLPKSMVVKFYQWLKNNNFPEGFQILCHNCNGSYGKYGYCPHNNPQPL